MSDHRSPTSKTSTSWGGHGEGTFGPRETTTVTGHVVHHPSQETDRDIDLGAEPIDEEWLTSAVMSRLAHEDDLNPRDVNVRRVRREVTLIGTVPDADMKKVAGMVARGTPGVEKVVNQLRVVESEAA